MQAQIALRAACPGLLVELQVCVCVCEIHCLWKMPVKMNKKMQFYDVTTMSLSQLSRGSNGTALLSFQTATF